MNPPKFLYLHYLTVLIVSTGVTSAGFAAPVEGVGNFQKVDEHVYRGAQPTRAGFSHLSQLGIQTVIDLGEPGDRSTSERRADARDGHTFQ